MRKVTNREIYIYHQSDEQIYWIKDGLTGKRKTEKWLKNIFQIYEDDILDKTLHFEIIQTQRHVLYIFYIP